MGLKDIKTEGVFLGVALILGFFAALSGLLRQLIPNLTNVKLGLFFFVIALIFVFYIAYIILAKRFAFDKVSFVVLLIALAICGGFVYFVISKYPNALGGLFSVWDPRLIAEQAKSLIP